MKFTSDYRKLFGRIESATHEAGEDIHEAIRQKTPRKSGRLSASYDLETVTSDPGHVLLAISSDLPYAMAIERGAWVKGRGPHIRRGNHVLRDAGKTFGRRMSARLKRVG